MEEAWRSDVLFHALRKHVDERLGGSIVVAVVEIALSIALFVDRRRTRGQSRGRPP